MTRIALPEPEASLIKLLESMEQARLHLAGAYDTIGHVLIERGAVPTWLAASYNVAAVNLRDGQRAVMDLMRSQGVPGIAAEPPWPPVFIDRQASQGGQLSLPPNPFLGQTQATAQLVPPRVTDGTLGQPLLWLGLAAVTGITIYYTSKVWAAQRTEAERERTKQIVVDLTSKNFELNNAQVRWHAYRYEEMLAACRHDHLGTDDFCARAVSAAVEKTPAPPNLGKIVTDITRAAQPTRSFLWWFGLMTVSFASAGAAAVIGKRWWDNRRQRHAG